MDKIEKALKKLNSKEKVAVKKLLLKIKEGNFDKLDIKKLKWREGVFRVRKGKIRIIFLKNKNLLKILSIEKRKDTTYKN